MIEIFADTAGWANFFVRSEPFHAHSVQLMQNWHQTQTKIITTNYVLTELIALFTTPLRVPRTQQINTIEIIKTATWVEIIHINESLDMLAWELLKRRQDKNWSLVDCSSIVVMQQRGISQAFTSDHHFEQAGYTKLLK